MSKEKHLCTCITSFLYISLSSLHDYDLKLPNFTFYWGHECTTMTFFSFSQTLIQSLTIQFQKKIAIIWKIKTVGVRAMKFGTVRIQFFGEDFRCRCRRGCFLFFFFCCCCCCCCCFLLVIFLSVVCDWHKFYAFFFLLVIFMKKLFLFCVTRMLGMERSLFSHVMTTTMIQKAKI